MINTLHNIQTRFDVIHSLHIDAMHILQYNCKLKLDSDLYLVYHY